MSETQRELRGTVTKLFFTSPTFCAGKLLPNAEDVTRRTEVAFAGKVFVRIGEAVRFKGEWTEHPKFGRQFTASERVEESTLDANGLAAWLAVHGEAAGIGPVKAARIAREFGDNFTGVLRDNPEQIAIAAQLPLDAVERLADSWMEHEERNNLGTKLAAYGLTAHQVHSLYEKFKGSVVALLEEDPYLLIREIPGLGFARVDEIARKLGVSDTHPGRLGAALLYVLAQARQDGSTCAERSQIVGQAVEALVLDRQDAESLLADRLDGLAAEEPRPRAVEVKDGQRRFYALPACHRHETVVAEFLASADVPNRHFPGEVGGDVTYYCPELDESQQRAVSLALTNRACLITGGAGSGKTTTIRAIARLYLADDLSVVLCAPTGKAARRLEEVVTGCRASTIHRLLEYMPRAGGFQRHRGNPIDADVVIVDEISMLDSELAACLFSAIDGDTAIVLVGDHHQLPPVGAGALLRDCIMHELLPVAILGQCHRQAGPLKHNAAAILLGEVADTVPPSDDGSAGPWYVHRRLNTPEDVLGCIERLFRKVLAGKFGYDLLADVQFLTPIHKGPLGTVAINGLLQRLHQQTLGVAIPPLAADERPKLHYGDKVIQTKNNYDLDVMNGHQGVVVEARPLVVQFDGRTIPIPKDCTGEIELAYCLTPHKVQGSEFPCVVTVCHKSHSFMTHRNWLYTALTRAKKTAILLGDDRGITSAAAKIKTNERRTLLGLFARSRQDVL